VLQQRRSDSSEDGDVLVDSGSYSSDYGDVTIDNDGAMSDSDDAPAAGGAYI
jgi:hypothetical protein